MKTFYIETLGCKVNQFESLAISKSLELQGLKLGTAKGDNDICIINTCSVTGKGSMQSRQAIRNLIKKNPDSILLVTGCYAQVEADEIRKIEGVQHIVGTSDKNKIPDIINDLINNKNYYTEEILNHSSQETKFSSLPVTISGGKTRPYLKIQDGCNSFCTYCIVPHARGRSRSMKPESVLEHLKSLKDQGFHEVVLTGIHIGQYGRDLKPDFSLYSLLKTIQDQQLIDRLRLSSIEPGELSDDIIHLYSESTLFCRHFHIPLQSGDNEILKRMHRPYQRELFENLILKIKKRLPLACIGVDTLIGFPGETNASFSNTYSLIENLPVSYLHVFPFSKRSGTPAYHYPDQVKDSVLKDRCHSMRMLSNKKRTMFLEQNINSTSEIIVEHKRDAKTGLLKGVTDNYITVLTAGDDCLINKKIPVLLQDIKDEKIMVGKIIN